MKLKKGFTLIELMVSFAIMAIVSTVIIYNHQKFNDNLEITNLSYEVALALRQAQVYGVSVRDFKEGGVSTSEENRFSTPYGIHFGATASGKNKDNTSFIFFADVNKDGKYSASADTVLQKTDIGRGNYVYALCNQENSAWYCDLGNPVKRDKLDITFVRPEPDARFKFSSGTDPKTVRVCLKSPQGRVKEVAVYSTGQISVIDGDCVGLSEVDEIDTGDIGVGNQ